MKKRYRTKNKTIRNITIMIFCTIIFLTVGYSTFSSEFNISGLAVYARIQKDLRITGVSVNTSSNNGSSNWENYDVDKVYSRISLPNSNSTVTFNVQITNIGNIEAGVFDITGLPSNLTYTLNNYTLHDVLCDDNDSTICKLGSVSTISITVGYDNNGYDSTSTDYSLELDFTFGYTVDAVAVIGNQYYNTLQATIDDVPTTDVATTVTLLKNTSEVIVIDEHQNVVLNLQNFTLSNNGNTNVISNNGTL